MCGEELAPSIIRRSTPHVHQGVHAGGTAAAVSSKGGRACSIGEGRRRVQALIMRYIYVCVCADMRGLRMQETLSQMSNNVRGRENRQVNTF